MRDRARSVATQETRAIIFIEMMRRPVNQCMRVEYTRSKVFFDYFRGELLQRLHSITGTHGAIVIEESKTLGQCFHASPLPAGAFEVHLIDVANDFEHTLIHSKILTRDLPDVEVILKMCNVGLPALRAKSKRGGTIEPSLVSSSNKYLRRLYIRVVEGETKRNEGRRWGCLT